MVWAKVRSRAATARLASTTVVSVARPSSSSPTSSWRWASPTDRSPRALRSSGVDSTSRANRKSSSSASSRVPSRSATISWARTACRSRAAAKVCPPAQRMAAPSATMSTAVLDTLPSSSSWTSRCRSDSGRPGSVTARRRPADEASASTTANRSAESCRRSDSLGAPRTAPTIRPTMPLSAVLSLCAASRTSSSACMRASDPTLMSGLQIECHRQIESSSDDSRLAMKRSTVRRARSSSSSDSPTIRLASVVARPPISLRSWVSTWVRSDSS